MNNNVTNGAELRTAVLVDCDNVSPEILEYALLMAAQFGRIVLRRGYGNQGTLSNKWQQALVQQAFTPCLQYQYASGKNTADIALALDAQEALFDGRVDSFCLVTSDSDFTYLCRKLRERGATVCIIGETKTPLPLRNACDQFFEWKPEADPQEKPAKKSAAAPGSPKKQDTKGRPLFVVKAVSQLVSDTSDGKIPLTTLGQYLKRTNPAFSPKNYSHSTLLKMIKTYDLLIVEENSSGAHWVSLAASADASSND
ncbi:MAG: NYN domain-containing protein [Azoarcus sp.]|jgi:uncharacterized protein (TIGR00288 family)|nr:NYN domain-containing protein [Azoarcus sp.]